MELTNKFKTLEESMTYILQILAEFIGANTFFIAENDGKTNTIIKALNRETLLVPEGTTLSLAETYCRLVTQSADRTVIIANTSEDPLTAGMDITGKLGPSSFIGVPIRIEDGEVYGTICAMDSRLYPFTERDAMLLQAMAHLIGTSIQFERKLYSDILTPVYNRNYLSKYYASLSPTELQTLAVFFIDIDNFKRINDRYGHEAGDRVLIEVAYRLRDNVPDEAAVARLGGDEFIVLLTGLRERESLEAFAEQMALKLIEPIGIGVHTSIQITMSIGVSAFKEGDSIDMLLNSADQAMYRVKQSGKNDIRFA